MADSGAEVIKAEPAQGDHNRRRRPVRDGHSSFSGHLKNGFGQTGPDSRRQAYAPLAELTRPDVK